MLLSHRDLDFPTVQQAYWRHSRFWKVKIIQDHSHLCGYLWYKMRWQPGRAPTPLAVLFLFIYLFISRDLNAVCLFCGWRLSVFKVLRKSITTAVRICHWFLLLLLFRPRISLCLEISKWIFCLINTSIRD